MRALSFIGYGGLCFVVCAFWIGHLEGFLVGMLGFFMFLFSLVSQLLIGTFYTIGKGVETMILGSRKVVKKTLELSRDPKVEQLIEELRDENQDQRPPVGIIRDKVIRLVPRKSEKDPDQ